MEFPYPQSVWSYFENFGEYPLAVFDTLPKMLPYIFKQNPSAKFFEPLYTWELLYSEDYKKSFLDLVNDLPDWQEKFTTRLSRSPTGKNIILITLLMN
ncbi:MAG: hypothetical protein EU530_00505 [Promethearchaeota archaeon]|nr:MAG: hypothetical protein EU530_00505 [Candidatus Lokiarchaeota archaeon]